MFVREAAEESCLEASLEDEYSGIPQFSGGNVKQREKFSINVWRKLCKLCWRMDVYMPITDLASKGLAHQTTVNWLAENSISSTC